MTGVCKMRHQEFTLKDGVGTEGLVRLEVTGGQQQAIVLQAMPHSEIWKYYPSTSKVRASVPQNLMMCLCNLS